MKLPYFFNKPAVTLPLLVAFAFAVQAPGSWSSLPYWPTSAIAFISEIFPPISGYANRSAFPEVTKMYMAFTFMLMPLHAWYSYKELTTSYDKPWFKNLWKLESNWAFVKRVFFVLVMCGLVFFSLFVNPGYDFNLMPLNSSRTALGLGGWIVAGGIQGSCIAWIYCNFIVIARFIKGY